MGEIMGLNVHTVQFKPDLYAPVCRLVRDYHPVGWDFPNEDPTGPTKFPMAANGVPWGTMYASWNKAGFEIDACLIFDAVPPAKWKDPARDARAYGQAFAQVFGPSTKSPLVTSAEVGNEPSKYPELQYRALFEAMARGLRAGDPKLKIATCAVMTGKPDEWSKPMTAIAGLEDLYDVVNVHSYAFKEGWPTWRRTYPEDPTIPHLKSIGDVIRWRDAHAPGKEIWLTEFGYDSATKPPKSDGQWKQWVGVTDREQAKYIVRSFLVLSSMDLDRAYLYFFNDKDEAQLHAASGITRNYQPKPSFHAMAHLYKTLRDYRYARAVTRDEGHLYCFEYQHATKPAERIYVAWSPRGDTKSTFRSLLGPSADRIYKAERMATSASGSTKVEWKAGSDDVEIEIGDEPVFLWTR